MEQNTVNVFSELAYKQCVAIVNEKNKPFVLHDEQRLQNCLTRFISAYNVASHQFFVQKAGEATQKA